MLTSNLHTPLIWECKRVGKPYDPDDPYNHTCSYVSDYGDKRVTWRTHRHTDGSVCEWVEVEDE
jgi:hypothetical protein